MSLLTRHPWILEVKILGLAPYLKNKFTDLMIEFRNKDRMLHKRGFIGSSIFATISTLTFYATFARVVFKALQKGLTIGDVAIYGGSSSVLRALLDNTIQLVSVTREYTLHMANLKEFFEIARKDAPDTGIRPKPVKGEIEFNNVTFGYPGMDQAALIGISLHIKPGTIVALVGENGAGKSTVVKLISGLYQADSGSVAIDGIDLKQWSIPYLHEQISIIFQEFCRYEATAAENIAYGDWQRLLGNRNAVEDICRNANIKKTIESMPRGLDTLLGRLFGEYNPSGGQWQSLAIARAFARDSALLILDEPTSNLDPKAEYELFLKFKNLAKGRTTILVSHRFSTVSMADEIIVLNEGKVVETGTHRDLLKKGGFYARLFQLHQRQMGVIKE